MSGISGIQRALKAIGLVTEVEASNLQKSVVIGAKHTRASINATDTLEFGGFKVSGTGLAVTATTTDFNTGPIIQTKNKTDLSIIGGDGFFILFDSKNQLYFTRQGEFHFDDAGYLVNNDGLYVASYNPGTKTLGKTDKLSVPGGIGDKGDEIQFNSYGVLINETRGLLEGRQLALARFSNPQGLQGSTHGPQVYIHTDAAGNTQFGAAGDPNFGYVNGQSLEGSNTTVTNSLIDMGYWQKTFSSTAAAVKIFLSAWDDLIATFK